MKRWLLLSHTKLANCYPKHVVTLSKELSKHFDDYILAVDAASQSPFDTLLDFKPDYLIVPYVLYDRIKADVPSTTTVILLSDVEIESELPYINLSEYEPLVDNTIYFNRYLARDITVAYVSDYNKETQYNDLHELLQTQDIRIFSDKPWPFNQYCGPSYNYANLYNRTIVLLIDENTSSNIRHEAYNCGCRVYNIHEFTHQIYSEPIPVYSTYTDIVDTIKKVAG